MPISNGVWLHLLLRLSLFNDTNHGEEKDALLSVPFTETVRCKSKITAGPFLALAHGLLSGLESFHEKPVARGTGGNAKSISVEIMDRKVEGLGDFLKTFSFLFNRALYP